MKNQQWCDVKLKENYKFYISFTNNVYILEDDRCLNKNIKTYRAKIIDKYNIYIQKFNKKYPIKFFEFANSNPYV